VPLPHPILAELRRLWKTHRNPRWLCPRRDGKGPTSRVGTVADVPSGGPRSRHNATHLPAVGTAMPRGCWKRGAATRAVQILLGHANIATTAGYLYLPSRRAPRSRPSSTS